MIDLKPIFCEVKECVRFKALNEYLFNIITAYALVCQKWNITGCITGASYENYPEGSYHDQGYAVDLRVYDFPHPLLAVCEINTRLKNLDNRYRIVYGDSDHTDHIHAEYRHDLDLNIINKQERENGNILENGIEADRYGLRSDVESPNARDQGSP